MLNLRFEAATDLTRRSIDASLFFEIDYLHKEQNWF